MNLNRYVFTVRQRFGEDAQVDCFYKIQTECGLDADMIKVMQALQPEWEKEAITEDTNAITGMRMRLRFNGDMFAKVCLVKTESELTAEELNMLLTSYQHANTLMPFLEESAI